MRAVAARVAVAMALLGSVAQAVDQGLPGTKLLVLDPTGDPARRKVTATASRKDTTVTFAGNPLTSGAQLHVGATGGTWTAQSFALPAAGWRRAGAWGYRYSNTTVGGAVGSAVFKSSSHGGVQLKIALRGSGGPLDIVPPKPGDQAVLEFTVDAGRYCITFGGAAGGEERRDDDRAWLIVRSAAVPCPPPSTTTSTATTTTETTTTTTTSTLSSTTTSSTSTSTTSTTTSTTTTETTTTTTTSTTLTTTTSTTSTTTTAPSTTSTTETTTTLPTTSTLVTTTVTTTLPPTSTLPTTTTVTTSTIVTSTTLVLEVNLLYVHGLKNCTSERQNAENSLADLETAVNAALPARIASWEAAHPGILVVTHSARANVYTATPSGIHPSDSTDPLLMDDWEVGDPGCSATQQGDPCTTGYEWPYRLAQEVNRLFPAPAKNIILIGHSAGARAAMEVAANFGTGGVNAHDWGVQSRIAGVVTLHGMIDEIGSSKYDVVGPVGFETGCKDADFINFFGSACAPGNGFCEWAGRIDARAAADWVATNKRARMLTSWGSCSPSAFSGNTDGSLPYDAQGSPWAVGLDMTPAPGTTYRQADGERYGAFCHSDITNPSSSNHAAARDAARDRILDWLFVAAPRVAATGTSSTSAIAYNQFSATSTMGSACPGGEVDDTVTQGTKGAGIDVVGVCHHPGFFDGDDHAIALSELTVTNGSTCNGTYKWQQAHDPSNSHAADFWWKTRSLRAAGPDLLASLPTD